MKNIKKLLLAAIVLFTCSSCGMKEHNHTKPGADTISTMTTSKKQGQSEVRMPMRDREKEDSISIDRLLKDALQIASKEKMAESFFKEYEEGVDSSFDARVNITIGNLFSKKQKHLIVRITVPWTTSINIYHVYKNQFKPVIHHLQGNMTYIDDSIKDVNGDSLKDYVVNWYASSGCCLKGFCNVYLAHGLKGTFTKNFEFINPTFSPSEHIVRGICYGHPGETEMYKYQWNGEKIDTINYTWYEKDSTGKKTGKIMQSKNRFPNQAEIRNIKKLNSVPKEFTAIENYDWFTGDWNPKKPS